MQWRSCLQRLARFLKPGRPLVLYPYTWAVLALILVTHLSFSMSAENTLKTLQAFSGNLTLLPASVATDERATRELHFMNQGLQEVLQEFNDAHK
jgi:hypothetical protein